MPIETWFQFISQWKNGQNLVEWTRFMTWRHKFCNFCTVMQCQGIFEVTLKTAVNSGIVLSWLANTFILSACSFNLSSLDLPWPWIRDWVSNIPLLHSLLGDYYCAGTHCADVREFCKGVFSAIFTTGCDVGWLVRILFSYRASLANWYHTSYTLRQSNDMNEIVSFQESPCNLSIEVHILVQLCIWVFLPRNWKNKEN